MSARPAFHRADMGPALLNSVSEPLVAGPILFARGADADRARMDALMVTRIGAPAPILVPDGGGDPAVAVSVRRFFGHEVWLAPLELPVGPASGYRLGAEHFSVATDFTGDLAIAFVSCNGQENGDEDRTHEDRDVMWRRLADEHARRPFVLLLQGGDQLYADEAVQSHPDVARWGELPLAERPGVAWTEEMAQAVSAYFFRRYLAAMQQAAMRHLGARVPTLMIWDDHDIFDGWGSHPPELQESAVAQGIFRCAREMFVLFQLGAAPERLPSTCLDASGRSFTQGALFPGLSVVLPDLRSERRPDRVMGDAGWAAFEAALRQAPEGARCLVVSSVPALGPRLSLLEALLDFYPGQQRYEDDLRDQWQSRAHRDEWARFLQALEREQVERGAPVTVLSGEIHLATRGEMRLRDGSVMHQLVASGITHPKPPAILGIGLGALSRLGHSPLPGRPIRIRALPGRRPIYTADRNYLVVERRAGTWTTQWELEESGRTAPLSV